MRKRRERGEEFEPGGDWGERRAGKTLRLTEKMEGDRLKEKSEERRGGKYKKVRQDCDEEEKVMKRWKEGKRQQAGKMLKGLRSFKTIDEYS